ncbi:hypothetical protein [Nitrogeniibacter aestuarii]|nr:hypothetical protein [Nitrogeniibacter aestuarii]
MSNTRFDHAGHDHHGRDHRLDDAVRLLDNAARNERRVDEL